MVFLIFLLTTLPLYRKISVNCRKSPIFSSTFCGETYKFCYHSPITNITDIGIISGTSPGISPPSGWTKIDVDLNRNTNKHYRHIYLCYKEDPANPHLGGMHQITIHSSKNRAWAHRNPAYIYQEFEYLTGSNGDLNQGAGGNYIYGFFEPITPPDIDFNKWRYHRITGIGVLYGKSSRISALLAG